MPARTVQTQIIITYRIEEDDLENYGVRDKDFNALSIQEVATIDGRIPVDELIDMAESVDINPTSWKFVETNRYDDDGVVRIEENTVAVGKDSSIQRAGDLVDDQKQREAAQRPGPEQEVSQAKQAAEESQRDSTTTVATDESQKAALASTEDKGAANKDSKGAAESKTKSDANAESDVRKDVSKSSSKDSS